MKNMRSFSMVTFSVLILLSSPAAFAKDPGMEFPGNQNPAQNREFVTQSFESAKAAYKENAPKVEAFIKDEYKNARDGIANFYHTIFGSNPADTVTPAVEKAAVSSSVYADTIQPLALAEPIVPVKSGFSLKGFFTQGAETIKNRGSQLKEAALAHPAVTLGIATIVAVPLVIYGLKKAKKINANTAKTAAIVSAMIASVAIPVAIAAYNKDSRS